MLILEKNQKEFDPGHWHYNMGTVNGEMQNWPKARYHFLLAEAEGFESEKLIQNKRIAEEALEIEKLERPLDTSDYLIKSALVVSSGPLVTISLLMAVVGLWLLKKSPSAKRALLVIFAVGAPLLLDLWIDAWPRKIVTSPKSIFEGPSALFGERGELPAGVLILTNTKGDWEEIIYPARFSGWVKTEGLERLELK